MHLKKKISPFLKVSFFCAIILHIIIFLFFHVRSRHLPDKAPVQPFVKYISTGSLSSDAELEEYAMLFDSAPLFISTIWNVSNSLNVVFEDVTLSQFPEFEPQIDVFNDLHPKSLLIMDDFTVDEPMDLLTSRFWRFFTGFGRVETPIDAFADTLPQAEIFSLDPLERQLTLMPASLDTSTLFSVNRPVVYHIRVYENRLAGSAPILVQTSGSDDFDQSVAEWIRLPEVLLQLPEGYLEIRVFSW